MLCVDQFRRRSEPAEHNRCAHGNHENGKEHHHTLDKVRARHGEKTADQRIEDHNACARKKRRQIRQLKNCLEEAARRNEAGRRIEDEEDQDKDRRNHA